MMPLASPLPAWMLPVWDNAGGGAETPLRPLTAGEILDRAFHLLRRYYRTIALSVLVFSLPLETFDAVVARHDSGNQFLGALLFTSTTSFVSGRWAWVSPAVLLLSPALVAGPVCRIAAAGMVGRDLPPGAALRGGLGRLPALLVAVVLADLCEAIGLMVLVIPGVVLWVFLRLVLPVVVVEGRGPFSAVGRSASLVSRRFWPVFGVGVLATIVQFAVGQLLILIPALIGAAFGLRWGFVVVALGGAAVSTVTWSYVLIVETVLLMDLRIRAEGLDLSLRIATSAAARRPRSWLG
ncbi:MAG: hypothetical protein ACYC1D_07195 [Acidimicrobiales bacterium]